MNKAEQYQLSDRWNAASPSVGDYSSNCAKVVATEEDHVAWPPVIARIRDLDQPLAPRNPLPSPAPETRTSPSSVGVKITKQRRMNQKISSRVIALAVLLIFLVAIAPFLRLRDNKTTADVAGTAGQPASPAPNAGLAPPWTGNTATTVKPSGKTSDQPSATLTAPLTNNIKPATSIAPAAPPPLLSQPEKKESQDPLLANPAPANQANPVAGKPVGPMATQASAVPGGVSTQIVTSGIQCERQHPSTVANQIADEGEYSVWPNPNPTKVGPTNAGTNNRGMYEADARADNRRPYNYVPDYRLSPATSGQNPPPNGQNSAPNGQYPPPSGRGGTTQPQVQSQYNPNQLIPPASPSNQSTPASPLPGSAAGAGQNGGYPPPSTYNNSPSAGNSGVGNPEGYSYPVSR